VTGTPVASPSVSSDPRHDLGRVGERLAAEHYERLGYTVLARNHRTRHGELDLVLHGDGVLVFAEVKTRRAGEAWANLHPRKRAQVRAMARAYLQAVGSRPSTRELRFDAVAVLLDDAGGLVRLDHLEGAF
jgi:putative endonuclease